MYDLILQLAMVLSLSAIVYLLARALPRVRDEDVLVRGDYFERLVAKIPISKIDAWFALLIAKFLRRLRVIILKFDNVLHRSITSAHRSHNGHVSRPSFLDSMTKDEQERQEK